MDTNYIVVLYCDHNVDRTAIGPATQLRCEAAYAESTRLQNAGKQVVIVLAAGVELQLRESNVRTAASLMAEWFAVQDADFDLIVNKSDRNIPSDTMGEIDWALERIPEYDNPDKVATIRFVTNEAHLRRVRVILWLFHGWSVKWECVPSEDPLTPLTHELPAYLKVAAVRLRIWPFPR